MEVSEGERERRRGGEEREGGKGEMIKDLETKELI